METESSHFLSLKRVEVGLERKFGQQRGLLGRTCGSCFLESSVGTTSRDVHASLRKDDIQSPREAAFIEKYIWGVREADINYYF